MLARVAPLHYPTAWCGRHSTYHLDVTNGCNAADKQVYSDNGWPIWSDGQYVTLNLMYTKQRQQDRTLPLWPSDLDKTQNNSPKITHLYRLHQKDESWHRNDPVPRSDPGSPSPFLENSVWHWCTCICLFVHSIYNLH